mgnify:CR=1 FL=1
MANISWMYRNLAEDPLSITETFGTSNTDYGTNRLADNNLQSYFSFDRILMPTGTVANILFDFGSSVYVDSLIVVHNLDETGTMYFMIGDTNPPIGTYSLPILGSTGTSVRFLDTPITNRYFKLFADGTKLSDVTKIREVFIGQRDVFPINPEYPFRKEMESSTIVTESEKGQKKVYHKYTRNKWSFKYSAINDATYGTMSKIRKYCSGSYKPFFFCIDSDDAKFATYFVRFSKNGLKHTEIMVDCHDIEINLEEEL